MKIERLESDSPDPGEISETVEALLDQLDTALMKRGTMTAETIDWQQVQRDALAVFEECLHLQALRATILSLCQGQNEAELTEVQRLLQLSFAPVRWTAFHPHGDKADRRRKQWGADMLAAFQQAMKQLDLARRGLPQEMLSGAQVLVPLAAAAGIDTANYEAGLADLRSRGQPAAEKQSTQSDRSAEGPAELDAKGRAELRRDLRTLAERVNRHEPGAEIAFLMRRYAAWLEFQTLPPVDSQGRIEQQPMPTNIADEFRSAAERPTDTALMRLEDRLFHSPDWFEGHQLAARIAHALGYSAAGKAIHDKVARRLTDLPGLSRLRYANDAPYLDFAILDWANSARIDDDEPDEAAQDTVQVQEPNLKHRIAKLEVNVASRRSRRARAVAKLALAHEFRDAGLSGHAELLLHELTETLSEPVLAAWDNELADEIRNALTRLAREAH